MAVTYNNGVFTFDLPEGGDPDAVTHAELDAAIDDVEDTIDALTDRVDGLEDDIDDLSEELDNKADVIIDTASGDIASFPDGTATPLKSLIVNMEPKQAGTGDPSPNNVRPISGWNGLTVYDTSKNLCNSNTGEYDKILNGTGGTGTQIGWWSSDFINLKDGEQYTAAFYNTNEDAIVCFYDANKTTLARYYRNHPNLNLTFTVGSGIAADAVYTRLSCKYLSQTNPAAALFVGATAFDYETGIGNSYPVTWTDEAGIIYSGILTVNEDGSGSLEVKTLMITDNGTSDRWTFTVSSGKNYIYMSTPQEAKTTQTIICNLYKGVSNSSYINLNNFELSMTTTPFNYVNIRDDSINSIEDFKSLIQNTPIQLLFTLSNPVTYQLTQLQVINAFKGYNAIWSDTGSVDVTYRADTKGYIDKLIAQVQALALGG